MPKPRPFLIAGNPSGDELLALVESWELSMKARKLAEGTPANYTRGIRSFDAWCQSKGRPISLERNSVREYMADCLDEDGRAMAPATVLNYVKGLKLYSKWLAAEGEAATDDLVTVELPKLAELIQPTLTIEEFNLLLADCDPKTLEGSRDIASMHLMRDTGIRASELVGIALGEVNQRERVLLVHGKGNRDRLVSYSAEAALALDRYLRIRRRSKYADSPHLLVSRRGPQIGYHALWKSISRHAESAGIRHVNPHMFRRFFADEALEADISPLDLKQLGGWRSLSMVELYTRKHANKRALNAQQRAFDKRTEG